MSGVAAVNHVAGEHKADRDIYKHQRVMVVRNAPENQLNQDSVPKIRAQVNILKFLNKEIYSVLYYILPLGKHYN